MLAARMMIEIARSTGIRLDLSVLATNRTIAGIAKRLAPGSGPRSVTLVPLQPLGSKRPLFCIHGGGGHVLAYADLAAVMPKDQPVYGLSAPDLTEGITPSVAQLAALYVAEIRKLQPNGPYQLCGYSFGGIVAYEMAALLAVFGETTDLLIILDTANRAYYRGMPLPDRIAYWATFLMSRARLYVDRVKGGRWSELTRSVKTIARRQLERLASKISKQAPNTPSELVDDPIYLNTIRFDAAADRYEPGPYAGRVLLVRSAARAPEYKHNPSLGWEKVARGGVDVITVPGDHLSMMKRPNVETLVARILEYRRAP